MSEVEVVDLPAQFIPAQARHDFLHRITHATCNGKQIWGSFSPSLLEVH